MDTKIKILIASVLKPVDDVRSFQKIGRSLAQTNKYAVNIIGFKSKKINKYENISFHPIFNFNRTSIYRLTASWKYYKEYIKVKPEIVIVSSPELLLVNYLIRILYGTPILYDVQENYTQNLKHGSSYPYLLKPILLTLLKAIEQSSRFFISGYILAEETYKEELSFIRGKKYTIIENKVLKPDRVSRSHPVSIDTKRSINMIYTGTIGKEYGTIDAIELVKKLHSINPNFALTITGYSADIQYLESVKQSIKSHSYIELVGGDHPVPHPEIIKIIEQSDMAILPYHINTNLKNRKPTKFYEYLAYNKPMLISQNAKWEEMLDAYPAALFLDFNKLDPYSIAQLIDNTTFYKQLPGESIYWDSESKKLLSFIKTIKLK